MGFEIFDRGETFSGVDYPAGLAAVDDLRPWVPAGMTLAQFALRWILDFEAVTCTIPGAKFSAQVKDNVQAAAFPSLSEDVHAQARSVYDRRIRGLVHARW